MNFTLVFIATIIQFVVGALWYSPLLFGKIWGSVFEMDCSDPELMKKMQKEMMPFYFVQLFLTWLGTASFAGLLPYVVGLSVYHLAFWLWLGFILPILVGSVIWGGTKKKYWLRQIAIMMGMQIIGIMITAYILST